MDNQEIFNQIRELQKLRTSLKEQDVALVSKINKLRDKLELKNIKKGYYTDNHGLFCRVYDIKKDSIFVYESNAPELYIAGDAYSYETFNSIYCRECTKEEYNNALDKVVNYFKD